MKKLLIIASLILGVSCKDNAKKQESGVSAIEKKVVNSRHPHECEEDSCRPLKMCSEQANNPYIEVENYQFCKEILRADVSRGKISIEEATKLLEKLEVRYADYLNDIDSTSETECSKGLYDDIALENLSEEYVSSLYKRSKFQVNCLYKKGEVEYLVTQESIEGFYQYKENICPEEILKISRFSPREVSGEDKIAVLMRENGIESCNANGTVYGLIKFGKHDFITIKHIWE